MHPGVNVAGELWKRDAVLQREKVRIELLEIGRRDTATAASVVVA
jgi:hypothetical protein